MIFRFDDVYAGGDIDNLTKISNIANTYFPEAEIIWAVSPLYDSKAESEYVFQKIYNAHSDFRLFFQVDLMGDVDVPKYVTKASHGLFHVDHRLLSMSQQEMSIIASCSLVNAKTFVPPFNKWNLDTICICAEHNIRPILFEDGWRCGEYNEFNKDVDMWYFHARKWTPKTFEDWLK